MQLFSRGSKRPNFFGPTFFAPAFFAPAKRPAPNAKQDRTKPPQPTQRAKQLPRGRRNQRQKRPTKTKTDETTARTRRPKTPGGRRLPRCRAGGPNTKCWIQRKTPGGNTKPPNPSTPPHRRRTGRAREPLRLGGMSCGAIDQIHETPRSTLSPPSRGVALNFGRSGGGPPP